MVPDHVDEVRRRGVGNDHAGSAVTARDRSPAPGCCAPAYRRSSTWSCSIRWRTFSASVLPGERRVALVGFPLCFVVGYAVTKLPFVNRVL